MPAPIESSIAKAVDQPFANAPGLTQNIGQELVTPGRSEQPQESELQSVRRAILAAGEAGVQTLTAQARIHNIAVEKSQRDTADRLRQEALNEERRNKMIDGRITEIRRQQFDILSDERSENAEWALKRGVTAMNNAFYDEERDAWHGFILSQQDKMRQDTERTDRQAVIDSNQEFRSADAQASANAGLALQMFDSEVRENESLQKMLLGDGKNIQGRVIEAVTQRVMTAAPYLFDIQEGDELAEDRKVAGEQLLANIQMRSLAIADQLIEKQNTIEQGNNAVLGEENIQSASQMFRDGLSPASKLNTHLDIIMNDHFDHLTPAQQHDMKKKIIVGELDRLSSLTDVKDPQRAVELIGDLLEEAENLSLVDRGIVQQEIIQKKLPTAV
ncbi:MAG: hypothetical protein L0220_05155, partial [Acidobacteria bacterium]|nr:hypothetical protein [Acidobacteriota bacterium]